jgi:hypothetical protein
VEVEAPDKVWHPYRFREANAAADTGGPFDMIIVIARDQGDHHHGDERGAA